MFIRLKSFPLWIFLALACGCGGADDDDAPAQLRNLDPDFPTITPLADTLEATIDNYLTANQDTEAAGISILVRKDARVVYHKSSGLADINNGVPVTNAAGFHLGQLSKLFTAIAIMQLHERGQLRLEDSVRHYLPELKSNWQAIEIQHLLSHRSGIYDYLIDVGERIGYENMTNQKVIDYFVRNSELEYPAGSRAKYSNTGYLLLAEVIARVSGVPFSEYMETHIFGPAGMTDSYISDELHPLTETDALNYGDRDTWHGTYIYTYGAQGQVSSTRDLGRFFDALEAGQLISYSSLDSMTQVHSFVNRRGYGYGLIVDTEAGEPVRIGHDGTHDGYRSILIIEPDHALEYAILGNRGSRSDADLANIRRLIEQFHGIE